VSEKVALSKRKKEKTKDAMGDIYIKVYRMRCVSVGINDDSGPVSRACASAGRIVVCVPSLLRLQ
jgi:hypothetical protein